MKVVQVVRYAIPIITFRNGIGVATADTAHVNTVLLETDAGYYQVVEFGGGKLDIDTSKEAAAYYAEYGRRVTVKRAVELFGSGISEKMDWSDE